MNSVLEGFQKAFKRLSDNFVKSQKKLSNPNASNVYENHKLIIYMRNYDYYGLWVPAKDLNKQREAFHSQSHLIVDSPIDGAMFLKITVSKINILNEFPND